MADSPLLAWCEEHGASVTDVADLTGYSVGYISRIARGRYDAPPHVKLAISRALRVRVRELFPIEETNA